MVVVVTDSGSIVVGIMYPPEWFGSPERFGAEVARIESVDPSVEVVVATYVEPHELRTARGAPGDRRDSGMLEAPPISAENRARMRRMHVAVAIDLPPDITTIAPELAWVQAVGSGTAHLQALGLEAAGVHLTSNGGSNSVAIAEFVIGRLLEFVKRFPAIADAQSEHRWDSLYGRQLSGQTIGLIGYGAINRAVAARASAFGMKVLVTRRSPDAPTEPHIEGFYGTSELHEMLARCHAVVAAVPETPETLGVMDEAAFSSMRKGAFFANVGRGTLVDEAALVAALDSGHLGGAALDVTNVEPLPPGDPLWDAPRLRISAHCSTSPASLMPNLHELFRDNLVRFVRGEPLTNEVSGGRGY